MFKIKNSYEIASMCIYLDTNTYFSKKNIMKLIVFLLSFSIISATAQINLKSLKTAADKGQAKIIPVELTESEVVKGLKEALIVAAKHASNIASDKGGFNNNTLIRIPFPKEAESIKNTLIKIKMQSQVTIFENALNDAAEDVSQFANEIFIDVIKNININDAILILNGADNEATNYLRTTSSKILYAKFKPLVKKSINKVNIAKKWDVLANRYNALPFTKNVNPDLEDYITKETINGLFFLIELEEKKIRRNVDFRSSDILKKVFK